MGPQRFEPCSPAALLGPATQRARLRVLPLPAPSQLPLAKSTHLAKMHRQQTSAQSEPCSCPASWWLIWRSIVTLNSPERTPSRPITIPDEEESPSPRVAQADHLPFPKADAAATGILEPCRHGARCQMSVVMMCIRSIELQTQRLVDQRKTCQEPCFLGTIRNRGTQSRAYLARWLDPP